MAEQSAKPYLVRALFEWCNDCGYTPYVTVGVREGVQVPLEYVKDGEIVLNVSPLATNRLMIGNEVLEFQARFGGVARDVRVPMEAIRAIYARETGQGMAFEEAAFVPGGGLPAAGPVALPSAQAAPASLPGPTLAATPLRVLPTPKSTAESDDPSTDPGTGPGTPGERPRLTRVK
jgi:stringent starvation protein B